MAQLLMTGFPGFLGSALLPRLLARRPRHRGRLPGAAAARGAGPLAGQGARGHRPRTTRAGSGSSTGDITAPGLGLGPADRERARRRARRCGTSPPSTTSPSRREVARRVNVGGTDRRARPSAASCPACARLHYVSTCYVSGRYEGEFAEDALDEGQEFRNHYESTKYDAELLVAPGDGRRPAGDDLPARASSSATRATGATQKYDGPYFLATFLRAPAAGRRSSRPSATPTRCGSAWCPATSSSTRWTSCRCSTSRVGRTYALADPRPADRRARSSTPSPRRLGKRVVWVPLPLRCPCTRSSTASPAWSGCWACPPRRSTTSPPRRRTRPTNTTTRPRRHRPGLPAVRRLRRPAARLHDRAPRVRRRRRWSDDDRTKRRDRRGSDSREPPAAGRRRQPDGPPSATTTSAVDVPRPARSGSCGVGTDGDVARRRDARARAGRRTPTPSPSRGVREAQATGAVRRSSRRGRRRGSWPPPPTARSPTGARLREVLQEWAVRRVQTEMPGYFTNARTVVLGGRTTTAPPGSCASSPTTSTSADPLPAAASTGSTRRPVARRWPPTRRPWPVRRLPRPSGRGRRARRPGSRQPGAGPQGGPRTATSSSRRTRSSSPSGSRTSHGKTVITSAISDERLADLAARDVDLVVDTTPQPFDVTVDAAVLEAMMRATVRARRRPERLADDDLLEMILAAGLEPRLLQPNGPRRKSRFAFVIHPLSQQYFTNVEPLGTIVARRAGVRSWTRSRRRSPTPRRSPTATSPASPHRPAPRPRAGSSPSAAPRRRCCRTARSSPTASCSPRPRSPAKLGAQVMGLGRVHQGRRRRRGHRGQAGAAARHHRQQLQRLGRAVGGPRGAATGSACVEVDDGREHPGQGDGRRGHRAPSARSARGCSRSPATSSGWCRRRRAKLLALKDDIEREHPARRGARRRHARRAPRPTWTSSSPRPRGPASGSSTSWTSSPAASSPTSPGPSTCPPRTSRSGPTCSSSSPARSSCPATCG